MTDLAVESLGYAAAVVTNISVYPQAYEVHMIVGSGDTEKLTSISLTMFLLQGAGCAMWFIYALCRGIWPVVAGSIMTMLPSGYIIVTVMAHRKDNAQPAIADADTSEIIVATGNNYIIEPSGGGYSSPKE